MSSRIVLLCFFPRVCVCFFGVCGGISECGNFYRHITFKCQGQCEFIAKSIILNFAKGGGREAVSSVAGFLVGS